MKILKPENLDQVVEILKSGGVIIYPTETTYGIGCDATNQLAVDRIYQIKKRSIDKPVLALVDSVEMAKKYWQWDVRLDEITKRYWPGALTILAPANTEGKKLAKGVVNQNGVIALRLTANPIALELARRLGQPLVSTSANIVGDKEVYDSQTLIDIFTNTDFTPDALIDAGVLPFHPPSTLVDLTGEEIKVLRQGELVVDVK